MLFDSLKYAEYVFDGIQILLCGLILIYIMRHRKRAKTAVSKLSPSGLVGKFQNEVALQALKQQTEKAFATIITTVEREKDFLSRNLEIDAMMAGRKRGRWTGVDDHLQDPLQEPSLTGLDPTSEVAEIEDCFRQGLTPQEIAEDLQIPRSEVELVLNLQRKRRRV